MTDRSHLEAGRVEAPGLPSSGAPLASILWVAGAIVLVAAASQAPALHRPDGWLLPEGWTVLVAASALACVGLTRRTRWARPGGLLALALLGQAGALAVIHAPNYGVIQHYRSWSELAASGGWLFLAAPLAQTVAALAALRARRRSSRPIIALFRASSASEILIVLAGVAAGAAYATWDVSRYLGELVLSLWIIAANGANLAMVAASVPEDAVRRLEEASARARPAAFPGFVAVWVFLVTSALAWGVFDRVPHVPDSVSHLFQAKYFSEGLLYLPSPPDAASFEFEKLHDDGEKWWGYGFPGWPAVLALGVLGGAPWLVNPVLGALTVLLAWVLARRLYDPGVAQASVALLGVSPWFLFMSASHLSHPASLFWSLAALVMLEGSRSERGLLRPLAGGACLGMVFLTRPLEALLLGAAVGVRVLGFLGSPRLETGKLAAAFVGGLALSALVFPYNHALTGDPLQTPHELWASERWYPGADRPGFGPDVGNLGWPHVDPLPGHGPLDVLVNAHQNVFTTSVELFGWGFGSLLFVLVLVAGRRWQPADRLFLAIVAAVAGGHGVYWFSGGPDFGARYWYQILLPLVVLTVRGAVVLRERWEGVTAFVVAASLVSLATFVPWRALGKYHDYRGMNADMARLAGANGFEGGLVFVREREKSDYARAFVLNPPTLADDGTIYARDVDRATRERVARALGDRPVWIVEGSGEPGGPFRILERPGRGS